MGGPLRDPAGDRSDDPAVGLRVDAALGLAPLDAEGGLFRRTYSSGGVTAIHYLVAAPDFSALHRLRSCDELFFFHAGAPLRMLILDGHEDRDSDRDRGDGDSGDDDVDSGGDSDSGDSGGDSGGDGDGEDRDGDSGGREVLLGPDPLAGQHPQLLIPAGTWQGASSTAGWSLVSTVVAPGFEWHDFELGERGALTTRFPAFRARIAELSR